MGGALANGLAKGDSPRIWERVYFPGETARASLKRDRGALGLGRHRRFPGRNGPGLIEATPAHLPPAHTFQFPGRNGPGLIEAWWTARLRRAI